MGKGKIVGKVWKIGNTKINRSTLIFNMGSAKCCPSNMRGLCKVSKICYALKAEVQYPAVYPYRERQQKYWDLYSEIKILHDLEEILNKRPYIRFLRYNEAGDFRNQLDVDKLSNIAGFIKRIYDVVTYGYTARSDLDFSRAEFIVRGSGWKAKDGMTEVWPKDSAVRKGTTVHMNRDYWVCPGEGCMSECVMCACTKRVSKNIAFIKH